MEKSGLKGMDMVEEASGLQRGFVRTRNGHFSPTLVSAGDITVIDLRIFLRPERHDFPWLFSVRPNFHTI